ncbi:2988_t:CDS:2, partial [Racocetra fulgida]
MSPSSPDTPSQENDTFPSDLLSDSTFFYKRFGRGHSHSLSIDSTMSIDQHPVVYSFSHALLSTTYETNKDSTPELTPNFVTPIDTFTQRSSSPKTPFFTEHSLSSTSVNTSPVSSSGKSASLVENQPRKLLLQSPMQQIMNSSSVQDRYLFLFNDLLIIAKPINANSQKNHVSTTEKLYQVKHIIGMHQIIQIALTMQEDRDAALINKTPKREPSVMATFSRKFSTDPHGAIVDMLERRHIKNDPVHIAAFLFKKSELSKQMSIKLTFAMLDLNCGLHERHNSMYNQNVKNAKRTDFITLQDFVNRFRRESDQFCLVPDELLEKIYYSIYEDKLVFAWDDTLEDISPQIPIKLHPARWPTRLTLLTPSDPITITIPHPDPHFAIRLHGQDLIFDPPLLDFTHTNSCTFTITGKTLGLHSMVLIKSGARCRNYINLPSTKIVLVERAFMKWTFQISFITDNGMIRKYHFSVDSQERRRTWVESIRTNVLEEKLRSNSLTSQVDPTKAAEAVALRILKDTLIPSENAIREFTDTIKDRSSSATNVLENISNG